MTHDTRAALTAMATALAEGTQGPFSYGPRYPKSYDDHGYRTVFTILRKGVEQHLYCLADNNRHPEGGLALGDAETDARNIAALLNAQPAVIAELTALLDEADVLLRHAEEYETSDPNSAGRYWLKGDAIRHAVARIVAALGSE